MAVHSVIHFLGIHTKKGNPPARSYLCVSRTVQVHGDRGRRHLQSRGLGKSGTGLPALGRRLRGARQGRLLALALREGDRSLLVSVRCRGRGGETRSKRAATAPAEGHTHTHISTTKREWKAGTGRGGIRQGDWTGDARQTCRAPYWVWLQIDRVGRCGVERKGGLRVVSHLHSPIKFLYFENQKKKKKRHETEQSETSQFESAKTGGP